eukprot:SAG31_NODE_9_length_42330_cov_441.979162_4_plen_63_part_00
MILNLGRRTIAKFRTQGGCHSYCLLVGSSGLSEISSEVESREEQFKDKKVNSKRVVVTFIKI